MDLFDKGGNPKNSDIYFAAGQASDLANASSDSITEISLSTPDEAYVI